LHRGFRGGSTLSLRVRQLCVLGERSSKSKLFQNVSPSPTRPRQLSLFITCLKLLNEAGEKITADKTLLGLRHPYLAPVGLDHKGGDNYVPTL